MSPTHASSFLTKTPIRSPINASFKASLKAWGITLATLLAPLPVAAFDMTSNSPIKVEADSARLDDSAGEATYKGDVVVTQDRTRLEADQVILYREDGELTRMEATGEPAHYQQPQQGETAATDAEALTIIYAAQQNRITLIEKAVIRQAGNVFRGNTIKYDTQSRVVTAEGSGDSSSEGRVEMTIQPRNKNSRDSGSTSSDSATSGAAN